MTAPPPFPSSAPSLVGHIRNRRATRAKRGGDRPDAGVLRREPETLAALETALREMAAAGVRRLAVEGGDGTVRETLTMAFDIWPEGGAPDFAIVAAGNTNLIARSAGRIDRAAIAGLAAASGDALRRIALPVLKVERRGERTLRGFIMGAGAYETATRIAQEEIAARHGPQVMLAVLRLLRNPALRRPREIGFGVDGDGGDSGDGGDGGGGGAPIARVLVGLTSLPGPLIYGLEPFWGGGSGPIRWLDVRGGAPRLALAAPFVAFGRPRRWMREHYFSGRAETVTLDPGGPFVLDGEAFDPGAARDVGIDARETAVFLTP